jgi:ABC-type glycerol-3-phosphate transport system substrate-binding protein
VLSDQENDHARREERSGITVKTDFQEYGDFRMNFNTRAAGGKRTDVFQKSVAFLRNYGERIFRGISTPRSRPGI